MTRHRAENSPEVRAGYDVLIADMNATADAIGEAPLKAHSSAAL